MRRYFRVLIVDDDDQIIEVVKGALCSVASGFKCEGVGTLAAAKAICRDDEIDLIILDLGLPDSYGFEGLEKLLATFPQIPIVIFTGHDDAGDALRAMELGAQDYVTKPIGVIELRRAVSNALARHRRVEQERLRGIGFQQQVLTLQEQVKAMESRVTEGEASQNWKIKGAIWTGITGIITGLLAVLERVFGLF